MVGVERPYRASRRDWRRDSEETACAPPLCVWYCEWGITFSPHLHHVSICVYQCACVCVETSVLLCVLSAVVPMPMHTTVRHICSWMEGLGKVGVDGNRRGGGGVLVSSNPAAKQDGCNTLLLITHTHTLTQAHKSTSS